MADRQFLNRGDVDAPATRAFAITPHDSNALTRTTRALWVGGAGNIALRMKDDTVDVTFSGIAAGTLLPVRVTHVRSTSTTATLILGLD